MSASKTDPATSHADAIKDGVTPPESSIVPARKPGQWISGGAIVLLGVLVLLGIANNENFQWDVVGSYFFNDRILRGLGMTLFLTVLCMVTGIILGVVLAVMRVSSNPVVSGVAGLYIWFFRGTPVLVQLIFWYNLAALFPEIGIGSPFTESTLFSFDTNQLISPFTAALLGLGLNEGAYMAEIVRAGISSVDEGQSDAGRALGMRRGQITWRIVLPQAMRVVIPPTGNETIGMLKMTSLVSVISLGDLLYSAQQIYSRNFDTIPLLIVISIWYLIVTSILSLLQARLERRFSRGVLGVMPTRRPKEYVARLRGLRLRGVSGAKGMR